MIFKNGGGGGGGGVSSEPPELPLDSATDLIKISNFPVCVMVLV